MGVLGDILTRLKKKEDASFDTFTFAVLNITIKYKCIFEKRVAVN